MWPLYHQCHLIRMQTIRPHLRPPAGKLRVGTSNPYFNEPPGFGHMLKSENLPANNGVGCWDPTQVSSPAAAPRPPAAVNAGFPKSAVALLPESCPKGRKSTCLEVPAGSAFHLEQWQPVTGSFGSRKDRPCCFQVTWL